MFKQFPLSFKNELHFVTFISELMCDKMLILFKKISKTIFYNILNVKIVLRLHAVFYYRDFFNVRLIWVKFLTWQSKTLFHHPCVINCTFYEKLSFNETHYYLSAMWQIVRKRRFHNFSSGKYQFSCINKHI